MRILSPVEHCLRVVRRGSLTNGLIQRLSNHTQLIELTQLQATDATTLEQGLTQATKLRGTAKGHTSTDMRDDHRWKNLLTTGEATSVDAVAELDCIPASEISCPLPVAFLAPDITRAALVETQPVDLTTERLKRTGKLPTCWIETRKERRDKGGGPGRTRTCNQTVMSRRL